MSDLMDKFVCIRMVELWGVDLSLFQFDTNLTWCVFFMNPDKTIYGRYGSRGENDTMKDISLDGFKKALQGALELHAGYPGNKKELTAKTGPAVAWKSITDIPALKAKAKPADGTRGGCVHCHETHDALLWASRPAVTDKLLWPYAMPDALGLGLDTKEMATVADVAPASPAEKAGFKAGDKIVKMDGQAIISIADVQFVLHHAKEPGSVKVEVDRGGQNVNATLSLAAGWRRKDDFTWRVVTWSMRHRLAGTEPIKPVPDAEKKTLGIANGGMALRINGMPPNYVQNANPTAKGLQKGDVIIEVDGGRALVTEALYLAYLMEKKPGTNVELTLLRQGKPQKMRLTMQ